MSSVHAKNSSTDNRSVYLRFFEYLTYWVLSAMVLFIIWISGKALVSHYLAVANTCLDFRKSVSVPLFSTVGYLIEYQEKRSCSIIQHHLMLEYKGRR